MPVFYDKDKMQPHIKSVNFKFRTTFNGLSWNTIGIDPTGKFEITNEAIYPGTIFLTGNRTVQWFSK
jgi:hypothetical protein